LLPDAAHIHPALVHFPIVLVFVAVCVDIVALLKSQSLTGPRCLPRIALGAWLLAAAFSIPTAVVGDMAFDQAIARGFPHDALVLHHSLGVATTLILALLAAARGFAALQGYALAGARGWTACGAGLLALAVLVTTAYFGGHLVYALGVNVAPLRP
jgi:uncharacterized membrane protein